VLTHSREDCSRGRADLSERFKALIKEVQKESGVKGPALFHPIRILLTGVPSGPEFDKLVPLMEEGARLALRGRF